MYREAEQTQATESVETEASKSSKESNGNQSTEDYSRVQYNSELGDKATFDEEVFIPSVPQIPTLIDFGDLPNSRVL